MKCFGKPNGILVSATGPETMEEKFCWRFKKNTLHKCTSWSFILKKQRYITIFYNHQFFIRQLLLHGKGRTVIIQLENKIPHPENFNSCFLWPSVWLNLTFVCGQVSGYLLFWTCLPSFHNASQGTVVDIDKVNKMMFLLLNISLKLPWIFFFREMKHLERDRSEIRLEGETENEPLRL